MTKNLASFYCDEFSQYTTNTRYKKKGHQTWNQHSGVHFDLLSNSDEVPYHLKVAGWNYHAHNPTGVKKWAIKDQKMTAWTPQTLLLQPHLKTAKSHRKTKGYGRNYGLPTDGYCSVRMWETDQNITRDPCRGLLCSYSTLSKGAVFTEQYTFIDSCNALCDLFIGFPTIRFYAGEVLKKLTTNGSSSCFTTVTDLLWYASFQRLSPVVVPIRLRFAVSV